MKETNVTRHTWLALSETSSLFRVNTGKGLVPGGGSVRRMPNGDVVIPMGRPISLGLTKVNGDPVVGTSDLIGFTSIEVTPEMVGHKLAVFTVIETKESGGGKHRKDQCHFIDVVRLAGGIGGFCHDPEKSKSIISDFLLRFRRQSM